MTDSDTGRPVPRARAGVQGRITSTALISGTNHVVLDRSTLRDKGEYSVHKEFTVKPGESLDLGDILIARPEAAPRR